jgi:predicted membrane protein
MTKVPVGFSCGSHVSCFGCFVFYVIVLLLLCCLLSLYSMFLFSAILIGLLATIVIGFWFKMYVFFATFGVGSEWTLLCNQFDSISSHLSRNVSLFDFQ